MFLHGLADRIQKEIFTVELPTDLDGIVELALCVDARLQQRDQRGRHKLVSELYEYSTAYCNKVSLPSDCEPMHVGRAQLSRDGEGQSESKGTLLIFRCCGSLPG